MGSTSLNPHSNLEMGIITHLLHEAILAELLAQGHLVGKYRLGTLTSHASAARSGPHMSRVDGSPWTGSAVGPWASTELDSGLFHLQKELVFIYQTLK